MPLPVPTSALNLSCFELQPFEFRNWWPLNYSWLQGFTERWLRNWRCQLLDNANYFNKLFVVLIVGVLNDRDTMRGRNSRVVAIPRPMLQTGKHDQGSCVIELAGRRWWESATWLSKSHNDGGHWLLFGQCPLVSRRPVQGRIDSISLCTKPILRLSRLR